jgi:hypothetical protein
MLSKDELAEGIHFVLKLPDGAGAPVYWLQKLRGDAARHWFEIYRTSDWKALAVEAVGVFGAPSSTEVVEHTVRSLRCVVIQPHDLTADDLAVSAGKLEEVCHDHQPRR